MRKDRGCCPDSEARGQSARPATANDPSWSYSTPVLASRSADRTGATSIGECFRGKVREQAPFDHRSLGEALQNRTVLAILGLCLCRESTSGPINASSTHRLSVPVTRSLRVLSRWRSSVKPWKASLGIWDMSRGIFSSLTEKRGSGRLYEARRIPI